MLMLKHHDTLANRILKNTANRILLSTPVALKSVGQDKAAGAVASEQIALVENSIALRRSAMALRHQAKELRKMAQSYRHASRSSA